MRGVHLLLSIHSFVRPSAEQLNLGAGLYFAGQL